MDRGDVKPRVRPDQKFSAPSRTEELFSRTRANVMLPRLMGLWS
jgi:hypothetical protein